MRHPPFEVFNVGTGVGSTVSEIVDLIGQITGRPVECIAEPCDEANFLPSWCVLDISKAKKELGWIPRIGLAEGIEEMVRERGVV